jgi:hypothetical protein
MIPLCGKGLKIRLHGAIPRRGAAAPKVVSFGVKTFSFLKKKDRR